MTERASYNQKDGEYKSVAMKTLNSTVIGFCLIMLLLCACEDKQEPEYESFLIEVEGIFLPENIIVNEPFNIVFSERLETMAVTGFLALK